MTELAIRTLEEIDEDKKVIISSEEPIITLATKSEVDELYDLNSKIEDTIGIRPSSFSTLCKAYNVKTDPEIEEIWKKESDHQPRSWVNMLNKFGKKIDNVIELRWGYIIENKKRKRYRLHIPSYILNNTRQVFIRVSIRIYNCSSKN